jgi:hypothetical protein
MTYCDDTLELSMLGLFASAILKINLTYPVAIVYQVFAIC